MCVGGTVMVPLFNSNQSIFNMKQLIEHLLKQLASGQAVIRQQQFHNAGGCWDFTVEFHDLNGEPAIWQTTVERLEIVSFLKYAKFIEGYDPATKQVKDGDDWMPFYDYIEAYVNMPYEALERLLYHHLTLANNLLSSQIDPEDLFRNFDDMSLIERQAWLRLMDGKAIHDVNHARNAYTQITNYLSGAVSSFHSSVPMEIQFFARWLKRSDGGLYGLCEKAKAESGYVASVA